MLRRKKLLKLGLKPTKVKTREERRYEEMLAQISSNIEVRKKSKKYQEEQTKNWIEEYSKNFPKTNLEPREDWAKGSTPKKSIFEPVKLSSIDTDEVNKKRKENNISGTIEKASLEAMEEIKRKATMCAPAYSKGAYQFLGNNKQNYKDAGKKNSEID